MKRTTIGFLLLLTVGLVIWLGPDNVGPAGYSTGCALSGGAGAHCTSTRPAAQPAVQPVRRTPLPGAPLEGVEHFMEMPKCGTGWSKTMQMHGSSWGMKPHWHRKAVKVQFSNDGGRSWHDGQRGDMLRFCSVGQKRTVSYEWLDLDS